MQSLTNSRIETEYRARTTGSAKLYAEACKAIPAGLTHDSRTLLPYPIYAARAAGPRSGTSTATSMSTISAGMARCCSATRIRPWSKRCKSR